jgi:hypothetical protein
MHGMMPQAVSAANAALTRSVRHACGIYRAAGRFQFFLVKPVLHQIADADDALQLLALDHRQMADHRRQHGIHAIGVAATDNRRRHQLLHMHFHR